MSEQVKNFGQGVGTGRDFGKSIWNKIVVWSFSSNERICLMMGMISIPVLGYDYLYDDSKDCPTNHFKVNNIIYFLFFQLTHVIIFIWYVKMFWYRL